MTMLFNFITALAWLWGGSASLGVMLCAIDALLTGRDRKDDLASFARWGFLPIAWLIARYWL